MLLESSEMCQMLFQNSQPHLEYPIGKTKLYASEYYSELETPQTTQ